MSDFELDIKLDVEQVKRELRYVQKEVIDKAASRAINRTAAKIQTSARREVSKKIGLPQKVFKKNLSISIKATPRSLYANVLAKGKELNLIEFVTPAKKVVGAFRKKKGVTAKPYGKKKEFKGAFIGRGKNSGKTLVYMRTSKKREPIKVMYGPSIPKTFIQKQIIKHMKQIAGDTWKKEFAHNLRYYLGLIK